MVDHTQLVSQPTTPGDLAPHPRLQLSRDHIESIRIPSITSPRRHEGACEVVHVNITKSLVCTRQDLAGKFPLKRGILMGQPSIKKGDVPWNFPLPWCFGMAENLWTKLKTYGDIGWASINPSYLGWTAELTHSHSSVYSWDNARPFQNPIVSCLVIGSQEELLVGALSGQSSLIHSRIAIGGLYTKLYLSYP